MTTTIKSSTTVSGRDILEVWINGTNVGRIEYVHEYRYRADMGGRILGYYPTQGDAQRAIEQLHAEVRSQ